MNLFLTGSPCADNHLLYTGLIALLVACLGASCSSDKSGKKRSSAREREDTSRHPQQPNTLTINEQPVRWPA